MVSFPLFVAPGECIQCLFLNWTVEERPSPPRSGTFGSEGTDGLAWFYVMRIAFFLGGGESDNSSALPELLVVISVSRGSCERYFT